MATFERPDAFLGRREYREEQNLFREKIANVWEEQRPAIDDFPDLYSEVERARDAAYLAEHSSIHEERPLSSIQLEYMMMDGIESRNWLGGSTEVTPASHFDDVANGIDLVVRFDRGDRSSLFLGVDVTTSREVAILRDKVRKTAGWIEREHMAEVKYYTSSDGAVRGKLNLPRVVLGTDSGNTRRLYDDFVRGLGEHEAMEKIDLHPLQIELLQQIQKQLIYFLEKAVETLIRKRRRKLEDADSATTEKLSRLVGRLSPMDLADELGSAELEDLVAELNVHRADLDPEHDTSAKIIFTHLELLEELSAIQKEKNALAIDVPDVRGRTERELELEEKRSFAVV